MRITESKLRKIIRKAITEHAGVSNASINETIDPATGAGAQEVDEAIIDYFDSYAEIIADEGLRHPELGPALLANDNYVIGLYIGQLDSFDEWHDQLKYDGIWVGAEYFRVTLKNNGFFEMAAQEAQKKNNY